MANESGVAGGAVDPGNLTALVADLPDNALDEHLSKDARGEFSDEEDGSKDPADKPAGTPDKPGDKAEIEKRLQEKEAMIGKQSTEIGTLRGQVSTLQEQLHQVIQMMRAGKDPAAGHPGKPEPKVDKLSPDQFFEDPEGHVAKIVESIVSKLVPDRVKASLEEKTKAQTEEQQKAEAARTATIDAVMAKVPAEEFRSLMPTIVEILVDDEIEKADIEAFIKDPFSFSSRSILALVKRARLEQQVKGGGKPSGTSAAPGGKAGPAKSSGVSITTKTGRGTESGRNAGAVSAEQLAEMSDAELDAYFKQLGG
jgi:hypothetical protein